jgi:GGDEF domain-containing protein
VTRSFAAASVASVASAAATATFASVGLVFLIFGPASGPSPLATVPLGAVLLTGLMLTSIEIGRKDGRPAAKREAPARPARVQPHAPAATGMVLADHYLSIEFAAAVRGRPLSVIMFRIDDFERRALLHDGSLEGLQVAAYRVLKRCTRACNLSVRDEMRPGVFLSVLSGVGLEGARVFVERARKELAGIQVAGKPLAVSAGVAGFDYAMQNPDDLKRAAEVALHRAMREGNRVAVVSSSLAASVS